MSKLRYILGLIALVLMFASCSKDSELFTPSEERVLEKRSLSTEEETSGGSSSGLAATDDEDSGTGDLDGDGISDDDDDEDDDDGAVNNTPR